jgi:hypothetical protein
MFTAPPQSEPAGTTVEACLEEFTLFPKLPAELRIKIWKLRLPHGLNNDGKRIFRLRIEVDESGKTIFGTCVGLLSTSMYTYKDDASTQKAEETGMEQEYKEDMKNLALLGAFQESRVIFEKSKSWNTLPAIYGGTIYFEDSTTIYIEGLMEFLFPNRKQFPRQLNTEFDILPSELNSIQHLVIGYDTHVADAATELLKKHKFRTFKFDMEGLWRAPVGNEYRDDWERALGVHILPRIHRGLLLHKASSIQPYDIPQLGSFRWD